MTRKSTADAALRRSLLGWLSRHGRVLPWRNAPSAYGIWVSEIMLQQTQVDTVIPYYHRFMERFPTVEHLAQARLERVLQIWSGLGYYRRARLMHRAAKEMAARFGGQFPADYSAARSLPGVGDYTARAVLSIAYHQPFPVFDGNVARVMARLYALSGNIHQRQFRRTVQSRLEEMLSRRHPGNFNQALMQLGQLVCTPSAPHCAVCPLRRFCKARLLGAAEDFPSPRPRRASEPHFLAVAVLRRDGRAAMIRGLDDALLGDLWNFPAAFGQSQRHARSVLAKRLYGIFPGNPRLGQRVGEVNHNITHRTIRADLYPVEWAWHHRKGSGPARRDGEGEIRVEVSGNSLRWVSLAGMHRAAVSSLARKIAGVLSSLPTCTSGFPTLRVHKNRYPGFSSHR